MLVFILLIEEYSPVERARELNGKHSWRHFFFQQQRRQ